ncbi:hypothetical protein FACS1894184_02590 [Clostridia bacterium]|nr:hypothetical protein FACS1894184_02590 [Clostridia bacterium]
MAAYRRVFVRLSIVFTVVMVLFLLLLTRQFSQYALTEIEQYNQTELTRTVANFEFILNRLRTFCIAAYQDNDIHSWLFADMSNQDPLQTYAASARMVRMLTTEPFIYKTYLINMRQQRLLDTHSPRGGVFSFDDFPDASLLELVVNNRPSFLTCVDYTTDGQSYFMMIYPSTPSGTDSFGYIVLLLNKQAIAESLFGPVDSMETEERTSREWLALGGGGEILMGSADETVRLALAEYDYTAPSGHFTWRGQRGSYLINYAAMDTQSWRVYYITPTNALNQKAAQTRNQLIAMGAALLFVEFGVMLYSARRAYKPISHMVALQEDRAKRDALERWIKQGFFNGSTDGDVDGGANGSSNGGASGGAPPGALAAQSTIWVAALRAETRGEPFDCESLQAIYYETINGASLVGETVEMESDGLILLIGGDGTQRAAVLRILETVQSRSRVQIRLPLAAALHEIIPINSDMRSVCQSAYDLTMLKFLYGEDRIYVESDSVDQYGAQPPDDMDTLLQRLVEAVKLGQVGRISPLIAGITAGLSTIPVRQSRFQLAMIVHHLQKHFERFDSAVSTLDRFDTLKDAAAWLERELVGVTDAQSERRGVKRKNEIVERTAAYVDENLSDPDLSADKIAERLSVSPGYIRQVFRDVYDVTIADYVLAARIDRVKRLLITTDDTIAQIAEQSGFQAKSHFFTAFKKDTGMTPSRYRQAHSGEPHE